MKKISIVIVCLLMVTLVRAQQVNDPNAVVKEAKNFHGIHVSNAFDVYLSQGSEEAVAVSASETEYRDRIKVEVKDGILRISYDNKLKWQGNKKLKAYISFKDINSLDISGACDVIVSGTIKTEVLVITLEGASDLKGNFVVKQNFSIDLEGASDMNVTGGSADNVTIRASGASTFKGFDLVTNICDAKASGASDISITVNKELSAHASGASDVQYKGDAVMKDMKTSGAGSVSKKRS
ncbi:MAG TPA: head GIN domain-containing protein [Chitinophagaceae bacterium]|nr:head GIN domain-containing protein [Chitinophagaceae bacterium]